MATNPHGMVDVPATPAANTWGGVTTLETVTTVTTCPACGFELKPDGICSNDDCKPTEDMRGGPETRRDSGLPICPKCKKPSEPGRNAGWRKCNTPGCDNRLNQFPVAL